MSVFDYSQMLYKKNKEKETQKKTYIFIKFRWFTNFKKLFQSF